MAPLNADRQVGEYLRRMQIEVLDRPHTPISLLLRDPRSSGEVELASSLLEHGRVVLAGPPGAGKTTCLLQLLEGLIARWRTAADVEAGSRPPSPRSPLPIFADLRWWHDREMGLVAYLRQTLLRWAANGLAADLPSLMRTGQVTLVLDGLDEMPGLERSETGRLADSRATAIAELGSRSTWRAIQCVVSCGVDEFLGSPDGRVRRSPAWHQILVLPATPTQAQEHAVASHSPNPAVARRPGATDDLTRRLSCLAFNMTNAGIAGWVEREAAVAWMSYEGQAMAGSCVIDPETAWRYQRDADAISRFEPGLAPPLTAEQERRGAALLRRAERADLVVMQGREVRFGHRLLQDLFSAQFCAAHGLTSELLTRMTAWRPWTRFRGTWRMWARLEETLQDQLTHLIEDGAGWEEEDDRWEVRQRAAVALGEIGTSDGVAALVSLLTRDGDGDVRTSAALALGAVGNERATTALIATLRGANATVACHAAEALGILGDVRAVVPLSTMLGSRDLEMREAAIQGLVLLGSRALPVLSAGLQDEARAAPVAEALGRIGDRQALPWLLCVIRNAGAAPSARAAATLAAGRLAGPQALGDLLGLLHDPWEEGVVREAAVDALGELGDEAAIEPLIEALRDPDVQLRWRAARALGRLGDERATEVLVGALADEVVVRQYAVLALGNIADRRALTPLVEALQDRDVVVREYAAGALGRLGDQRAVEPLIRSLETADAGLHFHVVRALGQVGDLRVVPILEQMVRQAPSDSSTSALARSASSARWKIRHRIGSRIDRRPSD